MPSPFPGMDPYLESPAVWPGVHHGLIEVIRELLVPQLRPRYFVDVERRLYVLDEDDPARNTRPDVAIVRSGKRGAAPASAGPTPSPSVVVMVMRPDEVAEGRVVIRDVTSRAVVTELELLSPTNKTAGSRGREEYLKKRREVLGSPVHLIEVDLLRAGLRVPSVQPLPVGDYMVHVSRAPMRPRGEVFAWPLRDGLPVIPVPLRSPDGDVALDLGAALRLVYDRGGYDLMLDYTAPADPPLGPEDQAWARTLIARP